MQVYESGERRYFAAVMIQIRKNDEGAEGEGSQRKITGRKRPTKEKGVSTN